MLHCIQIFTNTCEVTMQVKRAVGKAILQNYQYITNTCACVEPLHYFAWFGFFSPIVVKLYYTASTHMYILRCKCAVFLCARTPCNAMRRSIEICLLYGQRKHFWVVFRFYRWLSFDRWTDSVTPKLTTG